MHVVRNERTKAKPGGKIGREAGMGLTIVRGQT